MSTTMEMLAEQPFLADLTEHQLSLLAPLTSRSMFHAGNRILRQGAPADQFWLITDGRVYLDSEVPGYDNFVLETLKPGAVLGWSWWYPPYRWHFGAVAVTTTHTLTFNGALVRALCQRDPGLGFELATRFLRVMGDRLQDARRRLEDCQRALGHRNDLCEVEALDGAPRARTLRLTQGAEIATGTTASIGVAESTDLRRAGKERYSAC